MFSQLAATKTSRQFLMRKLFTQVNQVFDPTLPKYPLTAPSHTPLGVWAGRQLSECRRAQFVTGVADGDMNSLPVPDAVVEMFRASRQHRGRARRCATRKRWHKWHNWLAEAKLTQ